MTTWMQKGKTFLLFVGLWVSACESNEAAEGNARDSGAASQLSGRVFDADTGRGVPAADLETQSGGRARTAADGSFSLPMADEPTDVVFARAEYVPITRRAPGSHVEVEVFLKGVDAHVEFRGDEGVSLTLPSGGRIEIPAGTVIDKEGKRVDGELRLEAAELDGRDRMQASALPGDLKARSGETKGQASIERAIELRISDSKGETMQLEAKGGAYVELRDANAKAPARRTALSFDEKTSEWVDEGTATLDKDSEGKQTYRVALTHLSWWAYGELIESVGCVRACVEQAGRPVVGAQIWMVGANVAGVRSIFTDDAGCGAADVAASFEIVLVAQANGRVSSAQRFDVSANERTAAVDPAACDDAGTLVLEAELTQGCPAGTEPCGEECVDVLTERASPDCAGSADGGFATDAGVDASMPDAGAIASALILDAGTTQTVAAGGMVILSATVSGVTSFDVTWTQLIGPSVTLEAADTLMPSFTAPLVTADALLVFRVQASSAPALGAVDEVAVLVQALPNVAPQVSAGADQVVDEGDIVQLTGSASDPDGITTVSFSQIGGATVSLSATNALETSFTAPSTISPITLVFELLAEDARGASASDYVLVTVYPDNQEPSASAGGSAVVPESSTGTLDGSASDADGSIVQSIWSQIAGPSAVIADPNALDTTFIPPDVATPQTLVFELEVEDEDGARARATLVVNVLPVVNGNVAPLAYAGTDAVVAAGSLAQLTGSASDTDGTIASLAWTQVGGTAVTLLGANTALPTFTAPSVTCAQNLVFQLTVTDDLGAISTDRVGIVVSAGLASALTLGSVQGFEGETGGLSTPGTLWQRGAPTVGPARANSGANVWATNLTGNYPDNTNEVLCLPPITRAGTADVSLSFYAWISAYGGDGLTLEALSPELGWTTVSDTSPAFQNNTFPSWYTLGRQSAYAFVTAEVPTWATESAHLRFVFKSNAGGIAFGAALDDLGVHDETSDPDGDGLMGVAAELTAYGTDPFVADTDGDGFDDGDEMQAGSNPLDATSFEGGPVLLPGSMLDFEGTDCGGLTALRATSGEATLTPDSLWKCGIVGSGPSRAHSGTRAWATNLTGNYADNDISFLYLPPIDLSNVSDADLSFRLWASAYNGDALSLQVETSPNVWVGLSPVTPLYDGVDANGAPGWLSVGAQNQYDLVIVPLTAHAGKAQLHLRFSVRTNGGGIAPGFYIDDLGVHATETDPDADGISGIRDEWISEGTDPFRADTDGDGQSDGAEAIAGTDSLNPADYVGAAVLVPPVALDFETSNGGLAALQAFLEDTDPRPDDRWGHGIVASGPGVAHSGTRAWATVLNGNYVDFDRSYLYLPPVDLRGLTDVDLSFRLWTTSYNGDGLSVEVQSANGSWAALSPLAPAYNGVDGNGNPAWISAGSQADYALVIIALDTYAGQANVKLRLAFRANGGGIAAGAYVDDLGIHAATHDPDGDGLPGVSGEWSNHGTDPFVADTDADGVSDGAEVVDGTAPLNPADSKLVPKMAPGDVLDFEASDGGLVALQPVSGENDFKPDTLWQWGAPGSGPGKAYSGTQVWATNLSGNYRDNDVSYLYLRPIDLSGVSDADLSFRMWSSTYGSDGLSVEVQTASGSWARLGPLTPAYNGSDASGASAWNSSPSPRYYTLAIVPLTTYSGQAAVKLRFAFRSNGGGIAAGFYLDDVGIHGSTQDPDGDGLLGVRDEWSTYQTDPLLADTDQDGADDGEEDTEGTEPSNPADYPDATVMVAGDLYTLESDDGGLASDGSLWTYGSVGSGPGKGASGVRAWCTNCTGNYFDSAEEYLYLAPIQVPSAASSTFALHLWNNVYAPGDGVSLEIWDATLGWQSLAPDAVRPYNTTDGLSRPAWGVFTGTKYNFVAAPLQAWSGQRVLLRFAFRSNGGGILAGAYLDDFALADEATSDPDGDGLLGLLSEYKTYGTDPLFADTDGDGVNDGTEIANDSDPLNASSF